MIPDTQIKEYTDREVLEFDGKPKKI